MVSALMIRTASGSVIVIVSDTSIFCSTMESTEQEIEKKKNSERVGWLIESVLAL